MYSVAGGTVISQPGWLRRLRDGVRQNVTVLQRSGMGFSPERSGGSCSDVVRSEQRNDKPGRAGIGVYRACRFGAEC